MTLQTAAETATSDGFLGGSARRAPAARLGVVVVHDLVAAIVTGSVKTGDLLPPETELTTHFGVSRTVIRESVKRLEEKGMVKVVQGRGTEVTPAADWNILDQVVLSTMIEHDETLGILDELAVVRTQLESAMAGSAADVRTDADLTELRAAMEHMRTAIDAPEDFSQADIDFHAIIMKVSGNRLAQGIARTLVIRAREYGRFHGAPGPDARSLTITEHESILQAIADGDTARAEREMHAHIATAWARRRLPN
jgi:DNA-binding FadR family transcriptional regulator